VATLITGGSSQHSVAWLVCCSKWA